MPKRSDYITYGTDQHVHLAGLHQCRGSDLYDGPGIAKGTIIQGLHGFVVAENDVPNVSGKSVLFVPNGQCQWQGQILTCLSLPGSPPKKQLPCRNYIVAEIPNAKTEALLVAAGIPIVPSAVDGRKLVNLEIDSAVRTNKIRRAKFLPCK